MSRCYTFPPPGYEKKNIIDDVDVLAKEKREEKKHKKDKDREKKDGKVKKDKDRSKEKSKEKKSRGEKHKHKKDRKEKSKDKEKNYGTSNDKKKPEGHLNSVNGATFNSSALQTETHNSGDLNHAKELAKRIRVEGQATGSQIVHKNTATDEGKVNGTINPNNLVVLAKRMVEKEKNASGGLILQKIRPLDQAEVQMHTRTDDRNDCFLPEPNQQGNSRQVDYRMVYGIMDSSHLKGLSKRMAEKEKNGLGGQIVQKNWLMDQAKIKMHTRTDDGNGCFVPEPNGKEKGMQVDGRAVNGTMDSSQLQVSAKRNLAKEKNGLGGQIVQKIRLMDQAKVQMHTRTDDGNGCFVSEPNGKEQGTQVDGRTVNSTMDSRQLQVPAKRNLAKEKNGLESQIVQKRLIDQAKVQMHRRTDDGNSCFVPEPNGKDKGTQVDNRTVDGGRNFEEATHAKNVVAYWGCSEPSEAKDVRIDSEGTDKSEYNRESNFMMDKSKDRDKKSKVKDKVRDKEKRKEEKAKEKGELSNGQSKGIKGGSEQNDTCSVKPPEGLAATGKFLASDGELGKRKGLEINGFLHENGSRPHKLLKPVVSSPTNLQNGRKSKACQTEKRKTDSDVVGLKNGLIEAPLRKVSPKSPLPTDMEASMRPPHPDSVLLDQILSLPKMDRTLDFDDQEWLFCNTSHRESLKNKIRESDSSERQMVWNHGTRIESADIFALPYVVPY